MIARAFINIAATSLTSSRFSSSADHLISGLRLLGAPPCDFFVLIILADGLEVLLPGAELLSP